MKSQQVVALLFCVLLSSTLAHEYLQAKSIHEHHARIANHEHQRHHQQHHEKSHSIGSSALKFREAVSGETQYCHVNCTGTVTITGQLQIYINSSINVVALVNASAEVAIVFDVNARLIGLFNGNNGTVIIFNITSQTGVYIAGGADTSIGWYASTESFADFFASITGLSIYFDVSGAVTFDPQSTVLNIVFEAIAILVRLDAQIVAGGISSVRALLTLVVQVYGELIALLSEVLVGLLEAVGVLVANIFGDIRWLIHALGGIGQIVGSVEGGLASLIEQGVRFDLAILLQSTSGVIFLANLLLQIGAAVSITVVGSVLTNVERLLQVLVQLGGGLVQGVDGVIRFVYSLVAYVNGNADIQDVIEVLVQISVSGSGGASGSGGLSLSVSFGLLLEVVQQQNAQYNNSGQLQAFIEFVEQFQNGTVIVRGVNISDIIQLIVQGTSSGIQLVIQVLARLQRLLNISLTTTIPALITYILRLLLNLTGAVFLLLERLFGAIFGTLGSTVNNAFDLIRYIIQHTNIPAIIANITNVDRVLSNIAIIGPIYNAIKEALQESGEGSINLGSILQGSSGFVAQLIGWINAVFGLHIAGGTSIGGGVNANSSFGFTFGFGG